MTTSTTPTIVLVHGGFADASGFDGVIRELQSAGHRVLAISVMVSDIGAPVILVGHSYGGAVITQAAAGLDNVAEVMFATQRPLSLAALTENATAAGWKTKPSWYLVSEHDNAITPNAERFMAERMGATTKSIAGSHTAFVAQPVTVAGFIAHALGADPTVSKESP